MSRISQNQLGDVIVILASILMIGGATWAAWENTGDTGLFIGLIGAGLAMTGALIKRNAQRCPEESADAEQA
jgi:hypothetical protein